MFENLNSENILLYAIKAYDKPNCIMSEFEDDMKRFNYLNRLFTRYKKFGDVKERLVINHIVVLCNVFGPDILSRLLFYKVYDEHYSVLKTFLVFLNIMPDKVRGIRGTDIISSDIHIDMKIANILREIK